MTELIDYLLIFWVALAVVVYVLGNIFGSQEQANKKKRRKTSATKFDNWSPYSTNDQFGQQLANREHQFSYSNSQQQHNKNTEPFNYTSSRANYFAVDHSAPHSSGANYASAGYYSQQNEPTSLHYSAGSTTSSEQQVKSDQYGQLNSSAQNYDQTGTGDLTSRNSTIPTATGFNSDCVEWVNSILYLFYTQTQRYGPIITESVYRSLNEKLSNITSSSTDYSDLIIEFNGINRELSTRPELTNIRTETESDRSVSANCKIYNKRISFNLSIRRLAPSSTSTGYHLNDDDQAIHYELVLENLEGKLKSMAMLNDKLIVIQFIEKPDTKILLRQRYSHLNHLPLINEDNLVQIILQSLTQVVVDLYFGDDADFPQYKQHHQPGSTYLNYKNKFNTILKGSASELKRQIKHDFFGALSSSSSGDKERKVFLKVVRAKNINYNQNVTCLLTLDVPDQQAISSTKQGSNPYWDEHFLFNVNDKSSELSIELWDSINLAAIEPNGQQLSRKHHNQSNTKGNSGQQKNWHKTEVTAAAKFLGLARISIDELRQNPVQKVNLVLQPIGAPADLSNSVGGELQVELLFLEHSGSPSNSLRKSNSASSLSYQQGDVVSIDRKLTPSGYVITTTTITKPAKDNQKQQQQRYDQLSMRNQSPISSLAGQSLDDMNLDGIVSSHVNTGLESQRQAGQRSADVASDRRSEAPSESATGDRLSRSRSRSRSFLRAIKKRFSFSRTRSRSVGDGSGDGGLRSEAQSALGGNLDTMSVDSRSRASSEVSTSGRAKSVPATRDPSEVPTIVINKGRLSDTASAFTFTHPKSQLVIEVMEPALREDGGGNKQKGRLRYYVIPDNRPNKRRWSKRGTKLHLFNEHQFVACHLAGSSTCHLCGRVFSRRPGKQGYKCRNCHLLSHKQCHVKVDHNCPYATRDGLKLEYIDADPPTSLMDEVNITNTDEQTRGFQRQDMKQRGRPIRMAKSISVEVDEV